MFVYELSGCEFKSRCCDLNFRCGACFNKEFLDIKANYRVWIHSETRTWHDNNIKSIETDGSDHHHPLHKNATNKLRYCKYKLFDKRRLLKDVSDLPEKANYAEWENHFLIVLNKHAPLKSKVITGNNKPFVTKTL